MMDGVVAVVGVVGDGDGCSVCESLLTAIASLAVPLWNLAKALVDNYCITSLFRRDG
jgi:hypothetical protein